MNQLLAASHTGSWSPPVVNGEVHISNRKIRVLFAQTLFYLNITFLNVSSNPITWLPEIPTLVTLICNDCRLTELPVCLPSLTTLQCKNNFISVLPKLPLVTFVDCSDNCITRLLAANIPRLQRLICNNNPLTSINIQTLTSLEAYDCPLTVIHKIPSLSRRSSVVIDGSLKQLIANKEKINTDLVVINWRTGYFSDEVTEVLKKYRLFKFVIGAAPGQKVN
jgi:hypothetical protein